MFSKIYIGSDGSVIREISEGGPGSGRKKGSGNENNLSKKEEIPETDKDQSLKNSLEKFNTLKSQHENLKKDYVSKRKQLGNEHPDTKESLSKLGKKSQELFEHSEKHKLYFGSNPYSEKEEIPKTDKDQSLKNSLEKFNTLKSQHENLKKDYVSKRKQFGNEHPDTKESLSKLGKKSKELFEHSEKHKLYFGSNPYTG